jgi:hypothetical protein
MKQELLYIVIFISFSFLCMIMDFILKMLERKDFLLNMTMNDFGEYVIKLALPNDSNQSFSSSFDLSSKFKHIKLKSFE